ncbi:MAG: MFS transporter [Candidatus Hermodarchaeota archaeon]
MIISKKSVILILISVFVLNSAGIIVYTYVPKYLLNLGVDTALTQLIITIFPLMAFIFPPIYGHLSDKIQNRFIFITFGTIGLNFTFLFLFIFKDLILMIVFLFTFGFFMASSNLLMTLFAELVEDDKKLMSYFNAAIVGGWFLGAQSGGIFIDIYGIENIFLFILIVSLPAIIFVAFIRENRSLIIERYNAKTEKSNNDLFVNNPKFKSSISLSIFYGLFFRNFSIKPIMPNLAVIMGFHIDNYIEIGFLIGINFLLQFFQMLLIGHVISIKNLKFFIITGYLLSAISIFGYIVSNNFWSYLFFQVLVSFSYSTHWVATTIYIAQNTTPKNKGRFMGYANTSVFSGSFLGGLFFSLLLTLTNRDFYLSMYFLIIFPLISTLIIFLKFKIPKQVS